ncbi:ABC transporter ATP-binding protein [Thermomicrobium sp. CFH 73360]|uniref:ABC transporter ATP-binding protein n=1 Tax=Thermomicrobium sp. CFH 73360 TaxID=2951987 RepID=UPI002076F487|nr:ABC transporter ATP-binding protein [Thermomicrobium sp. CFH 73360]MCM8746057.1 ABC transporter ATP-binding protein [Thermomicrobium sp. CFH 73360]
MTTAPPIAVEQLTRNYDSQRGVIDLTFTVQPGEIFGFLGPNGAGKTTTIRVLMGFLRPTSGRARVFGLDCWTESTEIKKQVGYVPGDVRLWENMTGVQFLDFLGAFHQYIDPAWRRKLLERFRVELDKRIKHLSRGNRQKLALVQAFLHDPPLLILDEPTSGLDPLMQHEFLTFLREERDRGKTIFLSSHQLSEVERVADRVGIIREGRLVAVLTVEELKRRRTRPMELIFAQPVDPQHFADLPGVRVLSVHDEGRRIELGVQNELPALLRRLADLPVSDMIYAPPDLESVFLTYYQAETIPPAQEEAAS